jgi:hypothetical protein
MRAQVFEHRFSYQHVMFLPNKFKHVANTLFTHKKKSAKVEWETPAREQAATFSAYSLISKYNVVIFPAHRYLQKKDCIS